MLCRAIAVLSLLSSALAAPAVVWKKDASSSPLHTSTDVKMEDVLADAMHPEADLSAVIFVLGRQPNGADSLSTLASSGSLPKVSELYESADRIHHNCRGVESAASVVRDSKTHAESVLQVSLSEFSTKLARLPGTVEQEVEVSTSKMANKRAKALENASVLVVEIPPSESAESIDAAVAQAVDHVQIGSVVLTGARSSDEVKLERKLLARRNMQAGEEAARRRRLDEQAAGDDAANNNNGYNEDLSQYYYVAMTPNILAGLLFTALFAVIAMIGISCMGMIQGQDLYVKKMPSVGREA